MVSIGIEYLLQQISKPKSDYLFISSIGFIILFCTFKTNAQLPKCDIYAIRVENILSDKLKIKKVAFLNSFNRHGYNNQVFAVDENSILCSARKPFENDNEIYFLNIAKQELIKLTDTEDSEYSPRGYFGNAEQFTCVRVPSSDSTSQYLSLYDFNTGKIEKDILRSQKKIGYYRQVSDNMWACFVVDDPPLFALCNVNENFQKVFASGIGRCFEIVGPNEIIFVHKITNENWILKPYNILEEKSTRLIEMPKGVEDFCILENGDILCAHKSLLLKYTTNFSTWLALVDLKEYGITKATRLHNKGNSIFIVNMLD